MSTSRRTMFLLSAHQLIELTAERHAEQVGAASCARVCEELVDCLAVYISGRGALALFRRAVVLAAKEDAGLQPVLLSTDTVPWDALRGVLSGRDGAACGAACAGIVSELLTLFAEFLGEKLAMVILSRRWPEIFAVVEAPEETS